MALNKYNNNTIKEHSGIEIDTIIKDLLSNPIRKKDLIKEIEEKTKSSKRTINRKIKLKLRYCNTKLHRICIIYMCHL